MKFTETEFTNTLKSTESGREYLKLVQYRKETPFLEAGETHHIFPKSIGGTDDPENLVNLSTFEHCKAHALLAKAIPCYTTMIPVVLMSGKQVNSLSELEKVTLDQLYEWSLLREQALHAPRPESLKQKLSESMKGNSNSKGRVLSEESRKKLSNSLKGRVSPLKGKHLTEEHRKKLSESNRGKKHNVTDEGKRHRAEGRQRWLNSEEGKAAVKRWGEARRGKKSSPESILKMKETKKLHPYRHSEEQRRKISEARKGKPAWNRGIPMFESTRMKLTGQKRSEEQRRRMSEAHKGIGGVRGVKRTEESKRRMSLAASNRIWFYNGEVKTYTTRDREQEYLDKGWVRGKPRNLPTISEISLS